MHSHEIILWKKICMHKFTTKKEIWELLVRIYAERKKRRENRDENMLKTKKEALKLKKYSIEMREKELEVKKTVAINKIKSEEKRHDEILEI